MDINKEHLIISERKFSKEDSKDEPYYDKLHIAEVTEYNPETDIIEISFNNANNYISFKLSEINKISKLWREL